MLLTGHKTRAIFDRYNIIHEQELLEALLHESELASHPGKTCSKCETVRRAIWM